MWPFLQLATGAPALETADLGRVASSWAGWKVLVPEGTVIELASDADVSLRAPELRAHDELWTRVDQAIDRGDPAADALLAQAHAERPE